MSKAQLKLLPLIVFLTSCASTSKDIRDKYPELENENVRVLRIPDRFEGNTLIEAHRVFVFENNLKRRN